MEDQIFIQSRLIDPNEARKHGAFTTLPIRIHKRNDIADATARRVLRDWGHHIGDGMEKKALTSFSHLGNLNAFTYTEALPERLGVLSYLLDLGLIHDDASEGMGIEDAIAEHRDFERSLDIEPTEEPAQGSRADKLKKLAAQILLEAVRIDRDMGIHMLEMYQKEWLAIVEKNDDKEFGDLEEYYTYRKCNFGMRAFWPMVEYGMGFRLTKKDHELIKHVFEPIEEALMLTNDYWSWDREYEAWKKDGNRLVNVIDVVRRTRSIPIAAARDIVKQMIIETEQKYVKRKTEFYKEHPDVSLEVRRWIEAAGCVVSGSHYWATSAPRHHARFRELFLQENSSLLQENSSPDVSSENSVPSETCSSYTSFATDVCEDPGAKDVQVPKTTMKMENGKRGQKRPIEDELHQNGLRKKLHAGSSWEMPDDMAIQSPCRYIRSLPSKGVRSMLTEALNVWIQAPRKSVKAVEQLIRLLHDASLILDDIEDDSPLRRGKAATHLVFGHSQAINSANFMFVQAVQQARKLSNPHAVDIVLQELECLHFGQSWDLFWKHNLISPTEEAYMKMVDSKTGGLFRMLLQLIVGESEQAPKCGAERLTRLVALLGRFFQVRDDYVNLKSDTYAEQKGFCEDLDEGKFSYPIVHFLQHAPAELRAHVISIFRQRPSGGSGRGTTPVSREVKQHVLDLLESAGTLEAVLELIRQMEVEIVTEIGNLEEITGESNPMLRLVIERLSVRGLM
ncbi:geranylgeranyl pyrophosphate synthase [Corynespora cassiicola Philippines]|uniref:geranylgeranyl diphosphate synthase n=1 Tax=Corynespora cassiicola Philippines TaxID=1448308 RepID=A0A2T2P2H7_CORCC|nr:geranylgeranyl pyrophosphate synthase [Corynespora cassiicola Philippines]